MITVYGISNCDSVKKTFEWFKKNKVEFTFRDLRIDPVKAVQIRKWIKKKGIEKVVNKKSTTWREMPNKMQEDLLTGTDVSIILKNPTIIKRPVIETGNEIMIGYDENELSTLL
jgi:Spx/MgsR family transcriptional regulator